MAIVAALAVACAAWLAGPDVRAALDPHALATRLRDAGPLGALGLVALLIVQCVIAPIPSEPIMMAAGFVYGPRAGFVLAWTGVFIGAAASFLIARYFGRALAERLVRSDRLAAFDRRLAAHGLATTFLIVLGLRLFSFTSFDVLSYACGLIRFPLPWFLVATGIGGVPKILAFTYAGATAGARPGWLDATILVGTFGALALLPLLVGRWRRRDAAAVSGGSAPG